jgi:hypothetical protein
VASARRSRDVKLADHTPDLVVLSREDAESYEPAGDRECASISDPGQTQRICDSSRC